MRDARGTVMNIHTAGCVFVIIAKAGLCWQLPLERASYLVLASPQSPGDFSVPPLSILQMGIVIRRIKLFALSSVSPSLHCFSVFSRLQICALCMGFTELPIVGIQRWS